MQKQLASRAASNYVFTTESYGVLLTSLFNEDMRALSLSLRKPFEFDLLNQQQELADVEFESIKAAMESVKQQQAPFANPRAGELDQIVKFEEF